MTTKKSNLISQKITNNARPKITDVMEEIALFSYKTGELQESWGVTDGDGVPVHGWQWLQILSAVVLPDDPNESPHDYFDYEGGGGDWLAQALREGKICGTPAELWAEGSVRKFLDCLYEKFPKVKRIQA